MATARLPQLDADAATAAQAQLREFLLTLWQSDAARGVWQTVHGVEGSLPLVAALEGPQALVAIAQAAADDGGLWAT